MAWCPTPKEASRLQQLLNDAQRQREEAREAARTAKEEARTLKEAVQRMEDDVAMERKAIANPRAEAEASKGEQGRLRNEVGALTTSPRSWDEMCQKLETVVLHGERLRLTPPLSLSRRSNAASIWRPPQCFLSWRSVSTTPRSGSGIWHPWQKG